MNPGLIYTASGLDRQAMRRNDVNWLNAQENHADMRVVPVWRDKNLVDGMDTAPLPLMPSGAVGTRLLNAADTVLFLGLIDGAPLFGVDVSSLVEEDLEMLLGPQPTFVDLRATGWLLPRDEAAILAYARGLAYWHRSNGFCGRCGHPTKPQQGGHVRKCISNSCGRESYPRTDPAVIMLVHWGDRCVLAHNRRNPLPMFSTLAGFVEPGESLEEAVAREVHEEVGIHVGRVRYHSSQPWPFPGNIMLGFHAEAESTDIAIEEAELVEARWFDRAEIANAAETGLKLSRSESISRRLIDDWVSGAVS